MQLLNYIKNCKINTYRAKIHAEHGFCPFLFFMAEILSGRMHEQKFIIVNVSICYLQMLKMNWEGNRCL